LHWFDCAVIEYAYMFARGYIWVCVRLATWGNALGVEIPWILHSLCRYAYIGFKPIIVRSKCIRLLCLVRGLHRR